MVDVGTGCGAIAISVAAEAGVRVMATDLSLAKRSIWPAENAFRHAVARFVRRRADRSAGRPCAGRCTSCWPTCPTSRSDRDLPPDVKDYEPHLAIFGGARGTELIERFLDEARPLLAPGAELCLELDEETQAAPMAALARELYAGAERQRLPGRRRLRPRGPSLLSIRER